MEKLKKVLKSKLVIFLIAVIILIIAFCVLFSKDGKITLFDSMKKISNFYHDGSLLVCKELRCDIGKIKLDGKNVSLAYSNQDNNYFLIMDDNTVYFYALDNVIYVKSINDKYILIKKKDVVILDDGTTEEVFNYDFIDNNGNLLSSDELVNVDLSEVD